MTRPATGGIRKRGEIWWLRYTVAGVRYQESADTGDERVARSLLARRRREIADGTWTAPAERAGLARVEEARAELERALEASPDAKPITVTTYLGRWISRRREAGVRQVRNEATYFDRYVKPEIGPLALAAVTRVHVRDLVAKIGQAKNARTGATLSPRTVLHAYRSLSTAFADAVLDGLLVANPCTLKTRKGELPKKRDRDARWRASAVYSRDEAETMISDERIPLDRRALYALMLLGGLRIGEAVGRRWVDYDARAEPLGRVLVASQADGAKASRETKTGDARAVPVVPALAALLAEWKLSGFPLYFGRHPQPDDPIVPTRHDKTGRSFRDATTMHKSCLDDMDRAELGRRVPAALHSQRATFLSLLESDGANMAIARKATHAAPSDVVAGYIRTSWADLCREVGRLNVHVRKGARVIALPLAQASSGESSGPTVGHFENVAPEGLENRPSGMGPAGFEARRDRGSCCFHGP